MLIGFPMPIILALLINEIKNLKFRKVIQNITYMPNFLSVVIIVSMLTLFSNADYGLFNKITGVFGMPSVDFMSKPSFFQPLYVFSNVWQFMGFNAIIYIAALAGVDMEQHEAAIIDGATLLQRIRYVDLPAIMPTAVIMLILEIGRILNMGYEKILAMQNQNNLSVSEVIPTYAFKVSLVSSFPDYSYATAIGLFQSIVGLILILLSNKIAKKLTGDGFI